MGRAPGISLAVAALAAFAIGGCAMHQPPPPESPAWRSAGEAAAANWAHRIEPRFMPYLEGSVPAVPHGLHLSIDATAEPAAPCDAPAGELRVSAVLIDQLRQLAAALAFTAARPAYGPDLLRYLHHLRAARFGGEAVIRALPFDDFAGVSPQVFADALREPDVAALHAFLERDALSVVLAQRIGLLAGAADAANGPACSQARQARADAFAFDLVLATRRAPAQGQFPVFAMFVILDTDPRAGPAESRSLECRAAYFAGREREAAGPGEPGADQAALAALAVRQARGAGPC